MSICFAIDHWAAWASGLTDQTAWREWFAAPLPVTEDGVPKLIEMQPMMRRRVERLGRTALQAAYWCQESDVPCPIVFASRYGDMGRAVDLMRELAANSPLSPTAFSLAVHNAIGALYSIARSDVSPYSAIAAGEETVEAAFIEALGLLAEAVPTVMVVYYDEPLPSVYQNFSKTTDFSRAWACLLRHVEPEHPGSYRLQSDVYTLPESGKLEPGIGPGSDCEYPVDLSILEFLISGREVLRHQAGNRLWHWSRNA